MSAGDSKQTYTAEDVKAEVRQTLSQLSEMTRSDATFDEFCQTVLTKIIKLTGGHAALLWQLPGNGPPRITHKAANRNVNIPVEDSPHLPLVANVIQNQQPIGITSDSIETEQVLMEDGTPYLVLMAPVFNRKKVCCGALELMQRHSISEAAQEGYMKFLGRISELFPRWHEHHELTRLTQNAENMTSTMDFVTEVHKSIDMEETSFAIANESRRVLAADRVSVAKWNGSRCKVHAVSSQDKFDNRANVIRQLGEVATASVSSETPFWITGNTDGLPPKVAKKINDYMDESHCRTLAVIPLMRKADEEADAQFKPGSQRKKPQKLGALIVEFFDADVSQDQIAEPIKLVTQQSQLAISNAISHNDIFLLPVWTTLGRMHKYLFRDHYTKTVTGLVVAGILGLILAFWPAEMKMRVTGVMQPAVRKKIYTQVPGNVINVHVEHDDNVDQGTPLIELESIELSEELNNLKREVLLLQKEIEWKTEVSIRQDERRSDVDEASLDGEISQLEARKKFTNDQVAQVERKLEFLKIASPLKGTVLDWDIKRRLEDKPFGISDYVMTIADLTGKWQLELEIPDAKAGYIDAALQNNDGAPLEVDFRLATNPNQLLTGTLQKVERRAEKSQATGVPQFKGLVDANVEPLRTLNNGNDLSVGAGVTAKIKCGKRPLGKVLFYQVIDWLKTNVFF